ncbi:DedA family protein [Actinoplanes sp. CA-131856]
MSGPRRGSHVVVVARFFDGLRQFNGVLAGVTAMPWRRFLLHNTIGAALWVGFWVSAAYFFGAQLVRVLTLPWWGIGLALAATGVATWLGFRLWRRRAA